ncbi:hypothetical protein C1645_818573 [Glomus cerebriforme]|uniref:Protein kinase domain-containing protein n=1 Tax=Glomus cerebriforme TaxID=658196 RepID=A0A397TGH6_9GLOM|nr:hypothetical protein C1645_818573 [Glomus cerebriforme]
MLKNWTSGNDDIDKFIQHTQLQQLIIIRFHNNEYITKGGFGKNCTQKSLNNSKNVRLEFINEITSHHKLLDSDPIIRLYGISQDPNTKNYTMILYYAKNGSLRNCLDTNVKLNTNQLNRPTAVEIRDILSKWCDELLPEDSELKSKLKQQIQ